MSPKNRTRHKNSNTFRTAIERAAAALLVGLIALGFPIFAATQLVGIFQQLGTASWVATEAFVIESSIQIERRSLKRPVAQFRYEANGIRQWSERVHLDAPGNAGRFAQRAVLEHPIGATVTAYYNPKEPSEAVLVRGFHSLMAFRLLVLSIGGGAYLLACSYVLRWLRPDILGISKPTLRVIAWGAGAYAAALAPGLVLTSNVEMSIGRYALLWLGALIFAAVIVVIRYRQPRRA